jgi:DNA-binding NarL/FixJ family response regulator
MVDDDPAVRGAVKQHLLRMNHLRLLSEFDNAASALERLPLSPPDILLLDVRMPGMDGLE